MSRGNVKVKVNTHSASFYDSMRASARAPGEPEHRPSANHSPYAGPRTPEEWEAAFREMHANDETFREWQSAERRAELAAGR